MFKEQFEASIKNSWEVIRTAAKSRFKSRIVESIISAFLRSNTAKTKIIQKKLTNDFFEIKILPHLFNILISILFMVIFFPSSFPLSCSFCNYMLSTTDLIRERFCFWCHFLTHKPILTSSWNRGRIVRVLGLRYKVPEFDPYMRLSVVEIANHC